MLPLSAQRLPTWPLPAPRWRGAERTGRADLGRLHAQSNLRRGIVDVTRLKAQERGIR